MLDELSGNCGQGYPPKGQQENQATRSHHVLDQLVVEVLRGACVLLLLRLAALSSFATAFLPFLGLLLYRHPSNLTSSPPSDAATLAATTPYSVKKAKEG